MRMIYQSMEEGGGIAVAGEFVLLRIFIFLHMGVYGLTAQGIELNTLSLFNTSYKLMFKHPHHVPPSSASVAVVAAAPPGSSSPFCSLEGLLRLLISYGLKSLASMYHSQEF